MFIILLICALMVLLALWFVLPPLLQSNEEIPRDESRAANVLVYQDQFQDLEADLRNGLISEEQYQLDKDALERRLLEDTAEKRQASTSPSKSANARKLGYIVGAAIPVAAISFYFVVGNPKALTGQAASAPTTPPFAGQQGQMTPQQIEANVAKLAKRLEENPNDAQGWIMLGRSYTMMERFSDAASAYERATTLNAKDADVWADYGEALAMANGQQLAGKPTEAINHALKVDPKNEKALDLAGSAAFQAGDYKTAIDYWQRLLLQLPAGSPELRAISDQIAKAKQLAAGKPSR